MNPSQRLLVISALVLVGVALAFLMLEWDDSGFGGLTRVVTFSTEQQGLLTLRHGFYTRFGVLGIVLGVIGPLVLFAAAAFVAFGTKSRT